MCFNADTGKLLWEHKYNMFASDVPAHRIAWSSPVVDPATGNVFAISGGGLLMSLSQGRQAALGALARRRVRHVDDARRPHVVADRRRRPGDRQRPDVQLGPARRRRASLHLVRQEQRPDPLDQLARRAADRHDLREPVRRRRQRHAHVLLRRQRRRDARAQDRDRRAGLALERQQARPQHRGADDRAGRHRHPQRGEHRHERDGHGRGSSPATRRARSPTRTRSGSIRDVQAGYGSPVSDGELHLHRRQRRRAVRVRRRRTASRLWRKNLGTIQKSSPVLADGKLYVGTENGKFYILKPSATGAEVLDEDEMPAGVDGNPQPIIASPAVARGRVYLTTMDATFAIGPKGARGAARRAASTRRPRAERRRRAASMLLVTPTELILKPGESVALTVRAFDANGDAGRRRRPGDVDARRPEGHDRRTASSRRTRRPARRPAASRPPSAPLTGAARIRVVPDLPWTFDFERRRRRAAGALGERHRQVRGPRSRRQQGARQARREPLRVREALPAVPRADPTCSELHDPGRRARDGEAPPDGRHRHRARSATSSCSSAATSASSCSRGSRRSSAPQRVEFPWKKRHLVHDEARGADARRRQGPRARQGLGARPAEPAAWTIERIDPIGSLKGAPGALRRRAVGRRRRLGALLGQHQGLQEQSAGSMKVRQARSDAHNADPSLNTDMHDPQRSPSRPSTGVLHAVSDPVQRRLADVGRHARSQHGLEHEGAADDLGRQDEEERQVGRRARLAGLRQPGRRGRRRARRHQQRRRCAIRTSRGTRAS